MAKKTNTSGLKPFKKGQSGNPKGRPRKIPQRDALLADVLGEEKDGVTAAQAILMALRSKATKGDVRAAEVLLDRAYGKPKQDISASLSANMVTVVVNGQPRNEPISDENEIKG